MIMKKLFLFVLSAFLISTNSWAKTLVPLTVCIEDDEYPIGNGYGKTSMCPPLVYIEDYTLLFEVGHPEYVLNIKDENNNVVYTTVVYSTQTQVILPSTLSGDYVIELAVDNLLYTGWINL
jgi:hypothetical protein